MLADQRALYTKARTFSNNTAVKRFLSCVRASSSPRFQRLLRKPLFTIIIHERVILSRGGDSHVKGAKMLVGRSLSFHMGDPRGFCDFVAVDRTRTMYFSVKRYLYHHPPSLYIPIQQERHLQCLYSYM